MPREKKNIGSERDREFYQPRGHAHFRVEVKERNSRLRSYKLYQ